MSAGPTAGSPAPTGAGPGRATLRVVIADSDPATVLAGGVYAVLRDNGYAVEATEALEDGPGPATAARMTDLARGYADAADRWRLRADQLETLLGELAAAHRRATVSYAEAYLAAEGTQQARAATAELAAAAAREDAETLAGRAEAFRMILAAEARTDALKATATAGPAWPRPPEPEPSWPRYARDV